MKAPVFVLGLMLASLGVLAVAVYALDDETLFVSPPEMTAEDLLRAISRARLGAARDKLSRDEERSTADREIARVAEAFHARVGRVHRTEGEPIRHRGDTLLVRVSVQAERANPELLLRMVREDGAWSVTQLEDVLPPGGAVTPEPR
ncbi:MAG: hypothetical protein M3125_10405 [Gemmatimonadota bacterium]|nr:hypothetical protein [Gemmatimonadota bacterium]